MIQSKVTADAAATDERFEVDSAAIALSVILLVFQAELRVQHEFIQWALIIQRAADDLPIVLNQAVAGKGQLLAKVPCGQPALRAKLMVGTAEALQQSQRGDRLIDLFAGVHGLGERGGLGRIALHFLISQSTGVFGQRIVEVVQDRKPVAIALSMVEPEADITPFHRALLAITVLFKMRERAAKSP